ncbi:hypothetical protein AXG93_3893s1440 [Marchantia polymorpha subsp. ruderalis]|uniref:Uncharacterized protein n=1 Tax=Marchantia polymorpha subsp. ruderalis TaxID=1480154 RepID=A0A176WAP3_MARPO|nr:hypothetical protein AXG93_3893s1440 [Marchantia polymorpha subsp. ruderalis]
MLSGNERGSDRDLMFEKGSVNITRAEEFIFGPLFKNGRSGTNGRKTADYKDPKMRAITLGIMHILRKHRTTYITTWQVGFFERVMKEKEKRFPKEREMLAIESSEGTEEEDNSRPCIPSHTTASGPVQVDILPTRERPERRSAKRRKVVNDDEEDLMLDSRKAETEIEGVWQSRT